MQAEQLIPEELCALRSVYNDHDRQTGERLSSLESQMDDLCGNGQSGRIALFERTVQRLQQWRWWLLGANAIRARKWTHRATRNMMSFLDWDT
jgi:hypothetical protein